MDHQGHGNVALVEVPEDARVLLAELAQKGYPVALVASWYQIVANEGGCYPLPSLEGDSN
jgi:hypothetical protein